MLDRKPYLIIGCGTNEAKTYEAQVYEAETLRLIKNQVPTKHVLHATLHPNQSFDTFDIDINSKPTFVADINEYKRISSTFDQDRYQLVVFERFPLDYFNSQTSLSAQHLVAKNGMVAFLPTGNRIGLFKPFISHMMKAGFDKCVVSLGVHLLFFFNSKNDKEPLEILNNFIEKVPYVAQLLKPDELMQFIKKDYILGEEQLPHYLWDTAFLYEVYELSVSKKSMLEINVMLLNGQKYYQSPKQKKLPSLSIEEKKESKSKVIPADEVPLIKPQIPQTASTPGFFNHAYDLCIKPCIDAIISLKNKH